MPRYLEVTKKHVILEDLIFTLLWFNAGMSVCLHMNLNILNIISLHHHPPSLPFSFGTVPLSKQVLADPGH